MSEIVRSAPWQIVAELDERALAERLHNCFAHSISRQVMEDNTLPAFERRQVYEGISQSARALLVSFGHNPDAREFLPDRTSPGMKYVFDSIYRVPTLEFGLLERLLPGLIVADPLRVRRDLVRDIAAASGADPDTEASRWEDIELHKAMMAALPGFVSLLIKLTNAGALDSGKSKRGANTGYFQRALFTNLAGYHKLLYGRPPKTRDNTNARNGPSLDWLDRILSTAAKRIAGCIQPHNPTISPASHDIARMVRSVNNLSRDRKADSLGQGWRDYLASGRRFPCD